MMFWRATPIKLSVLILSCSGCVTLQNQRPFFVNLERSNIVRGPAKDSLLYEAQAATHIFLYDGLPSAFNAVVSDSARSHASAFRLIFSPVFLIRQLADSSAAVRTPSFMPRLMAEWDFSVRRRPDSTMPFPVLYSQIRIQSLQFGIQHHSNGQAGCSREGFQVRDHRANECVVIAGARDR